MKRVIIGLMIAGTALVAKPYTQADRIADMNKIAESMNIIQSGFFYNNYDTVEAGVDQLTTTIANVKPIQKEAQEQDIMEKFMDEKYQMTNKIVKKISTKSLTILQRFKAGDSAEAVQAYTKIMGQCMKCHREIRHW